MYEPKNMLLAEGKVKQKTYIFTTKETRVVDPDAVLGSLLYPDLNPDHYFFSPYRSKSGFLIRLPN
jgi:hypothetical protein